MTTINNPRCDRCGHEVPCTITAERVPTVLCPACVTVMRSADNNVRRALDRPSDADHSDLTTH